MSMIKVIYQVQHKVTKWLVAQKLISLFLKKKNTNLAYSEALTMEVDGINRYSEKQHFQYYSHKL